MVHETVMKSESVGGGKMVREYSWFSSDKWIHMSIIEQFKIYIFVLVASSNIKMQIDLEYVQGSTVRNVTARLLLFLDRWCT